jgi:hypothetical protein
MRQGYWRGAAQGEGLTRACAIYCCLLVRLGHLGPLQAAASAVTTVTRTERHHRGADADGLTSCGKLIPLVTNCNRIE